MAHDIRLNVLETNTSKPPAAYDIGVEIIKLCPDIFFENLAKIYNSSIIK